MLKFIEAYEATVSKIRTILTSAGLVDGLTVTELTPSSAVLFWETISSKENDKRESFVTFDVISADPSEYGDGVPLVRIVHSIITINSKKRALNSLIHSIGDKFILEGWTFEMNSQKFYSVESGTYYQEFKVGCVVHE